MTRTVNSPPALQTIDCANWSEFTTQYRLIFDQGKPREGAFLFRGQEDATWPLKSVFDRHTEGLTGGQRASRYRELLEAFRSECVAAGLPNSVTAEDVQLLALGQHYGLPTPLLDWSSNPLIAAYFAFTDLLTDRRVQSSRIAVWALRTSSKIWRSDDRCIGVISAVPMTGVNERLKNQAGFFTWSRCTHASIEDYVEDEEKDGATVLFRFTIPAEEAKDALSELDLLGVNASKLFSGYEGLARNALTRSALGV